MKARNLALAGVLATGVLAWRRSRPAWSPQGRIVAITGGSRGLGLDLARALGAEGAELALIARDEAELQRAAEELQAAGSVVSTWVCDLTDPEMCEGLIRQIATHHGGRIDFLINNAGEIVVGPFETFTARDFQRSLDLHVLAPLRLIQQAVPIMKAQGGGRIVNIASIGGKIPVPHLSPYCAGKFALVGLSGTLRAELAKETIVVTTVCPGLMRTGSHWNAMFKGEREREFAWFAHGASLPGASMSSKRAARQIVASLRRGDAELVISLPAQLAVVAHALAPAAVAAVEALVSSLLPDAPANGGRVAMTGWKSCSRWVPSFFTRLGDRAAARNNELRGHRPPA